MNGQAIVSFLLTIAGILVVVAGIFIIAGSKKGNMSGALSVTGVVLIGAILIGAATAIFAFGDRMAAQIFNG